MLFLRGIKIFILGYVLNFIRDFIPYMILARMEDNQNYVTQAWDYLFGIDILAFAGLALMFFAIVKKYKIKNKHLIVMWCVLSSVGLLLKNVSLESEILMPVFGVIWGTYENSWFPFLSWIFYPILGYIFAQALQRCNNKDKLYKEIFIVTLGLSIALWISTYVNKIDFGPFDLYQTSFRSYCQTRYINILQGGVKTVMVFTVHIVLFLGF